MSDILEEANNVIAGPRQDAYGPPKENFTKIASMWKAYLGVDVTAQDVAMMMVLLKVARVHNKPSRDTLVDIAGYSALADILD